MTQTQTTQQWTVTTSPIIGKPEIVNLHAISPTRDRVINRKNVALDDVDKFDGEAVWALIVSNKFGSKS